MTPSFWRGLLTGFCIEWLKGRSLMRKNERRTGGTTMTTEKLRDAQGRQIGTIEDYGGRRKLRDATGRLLGEYDGRVTRDANGRTIGQGDLLLMLLNKR